MFLRDKTLTCVDCGNEFTFSASDQEFYSSRGYQEPKRCPNCRQARRNSRPATATATGERQMFAAVCSNCGAETFVPFEPRQDRPVYCDDCFSRMRPQRQSFR